MHDFRGKADNHEVAIDARESNGSVANIAQLDMVKRNVQSASSTLAEATELSSLFVKVEEVFAAGDLAVVASMLSSMRRSLSLVGDVPEFREGRETLRTLEDRLQSMVEGQLSEALNLSGNLRSTVSSSGAPGVGDSEHQAVDPAAVDDRIRTLCGLLMAVGRYGVIEQQFVASRVAMATRMWQALLQQHAQQQQQQQPSVTDSSSGSGGTANPSGFPSPPSTMPPAVRGVVRQSLKIAYDRLPDQCSTTSSGGGVGGGTRHGPSKVAILQAAAAETSKFAQGISGLLDSCFGPAFDARAKRQLLSAALQPLEDWVSRWAELESTQLATDINAVLPADLPQQLCAPEASTEDMESLLQGVGSGVRAARTLALQVIHRSESVTGGSEVKALAEVLDLQLSMFVARLTALARGLEQQAGKDWGDAREGGAPPLLGCWMQMVVLAWEVGSSALLARVDASIRASLATSASTLQAAAARAQAEVLPDAPGLRMAAKPQQLQQILQLAASMADARSQLLPKTTAQVVEFGDAVHAGALEVLLAHVKESVQGVPSMPEWAKQEESGNVAPMPSFSAAPLPYITVVGEYLMLLPHHLMDALAAAAASAQANIGKGSLKSEAAADGHVGEDGAPAGTTEEEEEVDVEGLAAQWLDNTVTAAANVYAKAIAQVPHVTQQGGAQLAADAEYFCNVMSALHVVPPPSLITVQAFAALPDDQFKEAASGAAAASDGANEDSQVELTALRSLSAARKIRLS
ncbi:oligomeric Golgi complex subunit 7 [Dunaliella salina]|uniref:Conserved oligomeric Golgi complex subunit 7 n=1 Tax=Dunaliella salina TaxID=3046 RepID=A0ABQ7H502_DUNSA|nr:oligomeric Golgi complex subunit 7 [Dunaliella salina]|eukprot:KAF5841942.1 oligomeric Golgi complex subunit 7 [Dunaliella salina]